MMVEIRIQPSRMGEGDEFVRMVCAATTAEMLAELTATARHYTKARDRRHRASAWSCSGRLLATVGVSPDAFRLDEQNDAREAA
ncbi:MAG: hypothetical protein OXE96_08395 [Gemmatimonadetes bacterium]|nr:hypothetical protein [Gemmatimonadota bacterium]